MAKESSPHTFPIDLFVKRACHVAKISREYNGWYMYNSLLTWDIYLSLEENIVFLKKIF